MILMFVFAFAMIVLTALAYFFNDWYRLSIVTSVPFLALFS